MNADTENPPVDFADLAEAYGDESVALGMLEVFDTSMTSEAPLLHLLDAVLYLDFKEIKAQAHKLKGAASYANAKHMAEIAGVLQDAGIHEDKATAIEKMKELIVETRRTHIYVCELLKVPKETIDTKINELYDILKVYINESNAEDHIDHVNLNDQYGDEEMGFMMLEKGAYKTFCEEDFFEKIFKELLEEEYPTLKMTAHTMKGRGNYLFLPMLVKVCKQLQESARDQNQAACFESLIGVIDECLYIERYVNIKKLQKEEDIEKWIKLRPELTLLMEKRNDIPSVIEEIKAQYQSGKRATREPEGDANANEPETSSQQVIVPQSEPEEIKPHGSSSSSPVEGVVLFPPVEGVVFFHPHFHETTMKTVLEPIPEEKEKEELKQNESMDDERRRSVYRDKMSERSSESELRGNQKSPDSVRTKSNFAGLLDGQEESKADPQLNSFARSRSNILNVAEENKEEGLNLANNYNREPSYGDNIKNNEVNLDNGPASNRDKNSADDNSGAHIIIASKKKRNREDRADDDDYPFDTGLKCNMF